MKRASVQPDWYEVSIDAIGGLIALLGKVFLVVSMLRVMGVDI